MERLQNLLKGRSRLALMCFAILWIMAFHYSMYGNLLRIGVVDFLLGKGYLGVDIFFFLSAYGLCFSLEGNGIGKYYLHRLTKLYPLYLIYLLLFILAFRNNLDAPWYRFAVLQISGLATFTQMDVEWFIPALTILYILFPLIYRALEKTFKWGFVASAVVVTALALLPVVLKVFVNELFVSRLAIIAAGVYTFLALRDGNREFLLKLYGLCAVIGLCYIGSDKLNVSMTGSLLMPVILYAIAQIGIAVPKCRAIDIIGSHTLEIYLAQNLALNHFMGSYNFSFALKSVIAIAIIVVTSFLFYCLQSAVIRLYRSSR